MRDRLVLRDELHLAIPDAFVETCAAHLWDTVRSAADPAWADLTPEQCADRVRAMRDLLNADEARP